MPSSSHKNDEFIPPLYHQGRSTGNLSYFRSAHVKVSSNEQFRDFLEMFKLAILSKVRMKRAKNGRSSESCGTGRAIKFHPYNFVLGFTFPMP
ncbi:hypothetical protein ACFX1X_000327 [Malus domestica]